ncbi:MAG TPA: hypothetical protein VN253_26170, partial [Kofleriaceae bacterium]|nr:hypothetical protein [Kofleriaceae bacterium]
MGSPCPAIAAAVSFSLAAAVAGLAGAGCGDDGGGLDAMPDAPAPGTISLSWSVTDANGQPITCEQVGAVAVSLEIREAGTAVGAPAAFTCATGSGTTQELPPGTYQVDLTLVDATGKLTALPRQAGIVVESGRDTPIGPVTFAVDAVGTLDLFVRASSVMSNCDAANQQGAGWTSVSISLSRPGGGCQSATFAIGAGATRPATTYVASCTSPTVTACIERDQRVTAMDV